MHNNVMQLLKKDIVIFLLVLSKAFCNKTSLFDKKLNLKTLKFVHAIWRHGDRTPTTLIPTDIKNNITTWELGLGELTKEGMFQHFNLGKLIRNRYNNFLLKTYSPFEIRYRSSDYNRTLESAQSNAAGFFFYSNESFTSDLNWRPVPIHTVPKEFDMLLNDEIKCPARDLEKKKVYNSFEVKQIEKQNEKILRFLGEKSGFEIPLSLKNMHKIYDPLNSIYFHQKTHQFPLWVNKTIHSEIIRLFELSCTFLYKTDLLKRLKSGMLFSEILNRMKNFTLNKLDQREKLFIYSAHDTTLAGILSIFGINLQVFPKYATLILIELHKDDFNKYFIKLFYKNETNNPALWEQNITDCSFPCSIEKLELVKKKYIPLNWKEECGFYNIDLLFFSIILIFITTCIAIIYKIVLCIQPEKKVYAKNSNNLNFYI